MAEAVYILCAFTSILCAILLLRGYRANRLNLLFWSGLCFAGLALHNVILFVDLVLVPAADFGILRSGIALASMVVLLFGLIWEKP